MTLEQLRKHLNDTDRQIMDLIAERQSTINKIAAVKHSTGAPLRDYKRESEVFASVRARATELGVSPKTAEQVMRILIRESLTTQEHRSVVANRGGGGQRALIIGGTGKMGGWFAQFLESQGFGIEIADPRASTGPGVMHDWRESSLEQDYIVVAAPLAASNRILEELAVRRPRGVIFDVGSLKSPLRSGLEALRSAGLRVTSIHPMFGPDAELLSGRHVIFIDLKAGDAFEKTRSLFRATMAEQVVMELEEHDRLIAYVLGLSHAVNLAFLSALNGSGESAVRLLELSSTTFDAQFDIARAVAQENPELYFEIQRLNEYGQEALDALSRAVQNLASSVLRNDRTNFVDHMRTLAKYTQSRKMQPRP